MTATARAVTAIYPGTFDPITLGHEDIIRRAAPLFDRMVVAVAVGYHKQTMFTVEERLEMLRELTAASCTNVEVVSYSSLLSSLAREQGARVIVRGLRALGDFDYEFQLAGTNRCLMPEVETVFFTPAAQYQFISSSFVREIARLGGALDDFVSPPVRERLIARVADLLRA